jgi:hypothetical protein
MDEIAAYIKKELSRGFTRGQIRATLIRAGHRPEIVDQYLGKPESSGHKYLYAATGLILFLLVSASLLFFVSKGLRADYYYYTDNFEKAAPLYQDVGDYGRAGISFMEAGQYNEAFISYNMAPTTPSNMEGQATALIILGDLNTTEELVHNIMQEYGTPNTNRFLAYIAKAKGNYSEATEYIDKTNYHDNCKKMVKLGLLSEESDMELATRFYARADCKPASDILRIIEAGRQT